MDFNRVQSVLKNKEKVDIFYDERPVWIQGVNNHVAKVGFIDNFEERDVFIEDLYERNLYNAQAKGDRGEIDHWERTIEGLRQEAANRGIRI